MMNDGQNDGKQIENITREVSILRGLEHENIVKYFGANVEHVLDPSENAVVTNLNIFLEFVPGGSIQNLLSKFGSFPEEVISMYTRQILLGLDYLHQHRIIHRGLSFLCLSLLFVFLFLRREEGY